MSSKTTNLNLTKPSEDEFYDINVQNENMDIIDREINGLKQPAYEVSTAMSDLNSGEMITVAFGKIAKAVSTLISHITSKATSSVLGHVKLSDSTSSTSASTAGVAATPKAVKAAYDLANSNTKKIGTTDISGIGDGTVTGAIAENKDAIEDVTQSLNMLNKGSGCAYKGIQVIYKRNVDIVEGLYTSAWDGFVQGIAKTAANSGNPFIRLEINGSVIFEGSGVSKNYSYLWSPLFEVRKGDVIKYMLTSDTDDSNKELRIYLHRAR